MPLINRAVRAESNLGAYRMGAFSGIIGAAIAANSEVFQFRFNPSVSTNLCLIRRVRIGACVSTTFFAAGVPVQLDMIKSTAWTAAGTGGTALTPGAGAKKRTTLFQTSQLAAGDARIATTAALGAGTKTLASNPLSVLAAPGPITASLNGQIVPPGTEMLSGEVSDGDYPLILEAQEGFSIRAVAVPATGTWTIGVDVEWVEVGSY
mgnify:CR=1 FL=1